MSVLLDTNILLRLSERHHPHHLPSVNALRRLAAAGQRLAISSQSVYEYLAVATRPVGERGLGMNQARADAELSKLIGSLDIHHDSPATLTELRELVVRHGVSGKSVHDARLVAVARMFGMEGLLTLNSSDFTRYAGLLVLDPAKQSPDAMVAALSARK